MARPVAHPRLGDITLVGQPLRMSRAPDPPYHAAPERGEHNDEVYRALGIDDEELRSLQGARRHLNAPRSASGRGVEPNQGRAFDLFARAWKPVAHRMHTLPPSAWTPTL